MKSVNKRRWIIVLAVLGTIFFGGYGILCGVLYKYQDKLVYFPDDYFPKDPAAEGLACHRKKPSSVNSTRCS